MSTSVLYHAFQIKGVKYNSTSYEGDDVVFHADIADTHFCCPNCKSHDVFSNGQRERRFHLSPMGRSKRLTQPSFFDFP